MKTLLTACLLFLLAGPTLAQQPIEKKLAQDAKDRRAILQVLQRQTDEWNAGRIDKFMQSYWESDSLTFVGKAGVTYGYKATLANYQKRYPDRAAMGTLKFDILELDLLKPNMAYVIGKFHLTRPKLGNAEGYFTLVWRKIKKRWVIISDHTSA